MSANSYHLRKKIKLLELENILMQNDEGAKPQKFKPRFFQAQALDSIPLKVRNIRFSTNKGIGKKIVFKDLSKWQGISKGYGVSELKYLSRALALRSNMYSSVKLEIDMVEEGRYRQAWSLIIKIILNFKNLRRLEIKVTPESAIKQLAFSTMLYIKRLRFLNYLSTNLSYKHYIFPLSKALTHAAFLKDIRESHTNLKKSTLSKLKSLELRGDGILNLLASLKSYNSFLINYFKISAIKTLVLTINNSNQAHIIPKFEFSNLIHLKVIFGDLNLNYSVDNLVNYFSIANKSTFPVLKECEFEIQTKCVVNDNLDQAIQKFLICNGGEISKLSLSITARALSLSKLNFTLVYLYQLPELAELNLKFSAKDLNFYLEEYKGSKDSHRNSGRFFKHLKEAKSLQKLSLEVPVEDKSKSKGVNLEVLEDFFKFIGEATQSYLKIQEITFIFDLKKFQKVRKLIKKMQVAAELVKKSEVDRLVKNTQNRGNKNTQELFTNLPNLSERSSFVLKNYFTPEDFSSKSYASVIEKINFLSNFLPKLTIDKSTIDNSTLQNLATKPDLLKSLGVESVKEYPKLTIKFSGFLKLIIETGELNDSMRHTLSKLITHSSLPKEVKVII